MSSTFNICSLNVRGIQNMQKRRKLFLWLKSKNFTIYFLQETHSTHNSELLWGNEWGGKAYFTQAFSNAAGCGILFHRNIVFDLEKIHRDIQGRFLIIQIKLNEETVTLVNIYGHNRDTPEFFQNLIDILNDFDNSNIYIGGDFNFVQDINMDKLGGTRNTFSRSKEKLKYYLENHNLIDIWRIRHPQEKKFTWHQNNPEVFCRLDYFFIPLHKSADVKQTNILPAILTDHSLITVEIQSIKDKRGPGFWKLNCSLLYNIDYVNLVTAVIKSTIQESDKENKDPRSTWELIKFNIRSETIKFATHKRKQEKYFTEFYEKKIKNLEDTVGLYSSAQEINRIKEEIDFSKEQLEKYLDRYTRAAMIRSRASYYEEGEKNTKYFLGMEKSKQTKKCIHALIDQEGNMITNREEVLNEQVKYYTKLYTSKKSFETSSEDDKNTFFNAPFNKLEENDKLACEGKITIDECEQVIKTMNNNKSPGIDGLPCEFYKVFWKEIKFVFVKSLNYNYENGKMSNTQRQSIITLLPKKDKDIRFLKNWRPISLLNCDYKIAAKVIAQRIRILLPKIIASEQTGFIKNRYIGENIRTIIDLIDYTEENEIPGIIFSIDFEKAFDSIDWKYMEICLGYFGFGPGLIKWVKTFYTDISARTTNNGWASTPFNISRGVRQGCPLSPYLYIICAELLANATRAAIDVKGISVYNREILLSQFADDTQQFLDGSEKSLNSSISLLEKFEKCSGLKINFEKSECYKIGSLRNSKRLINTYKPVKWSTGPMNILGVKIPINSKQSIFKLNLQDKILNIKQVLNTWSSRNLTIVGRINIVKSLILPKLTYALTILPNIPNSYVEEIQKLIYLFIWNSKIDKIKRNVQINDKKEGGLSVPDIESYAKALKISWIQRYVDEKNTGQWKVFFKKYLDIFGGSIIFNCNMDHRDTKIRNIKNIFYKNILENWFELNEINNDAISKCDNQIIWNNKHILINNSTIFYREWFEKGIIHVGDLYENRHFITLNSIRNRFNVNTNFVQYFGLCRAIPRTWKTEINNIAPNRPYNLASNKYFILNTSPKPSKIFYWLYVKTHCKPPEKVKQKWKDIFQDLKEQHFRKIFIMPYTCTIETKLRNFQLKFIHRILPNRNLLFKMKKINNKNCTFCKNVEDSLEHMFWDCRIVSQFYTAVEEYLKSNFGQSFKIDKRTLFFSGI